MDYKNYITPAGYNRLKEELYNLVTQERPRLVQTVSWAAGNGDRSENGDYIYGKRRLREIDKRIHWLTKRVNCAEIVDSHCHNGSEKVFFGATVTILRDENIEQIVTIVGQDEIDSTQNFISWTSPLASILLRKTVGDQFKFNSPSREEWIEIIDVSY